MPRPRLSDPGPHAANPAAAYRALSMALCALALAACQPTAGPAPRSAAVMGDAIRIGLPPGYCIDRSASHEGRDTAVMLMGRCSTASSPVAAVVTVSVGAEGSAAALAGGGRTLAGFFTSDRGRSMLARSGRAADLKVLQAREVDGVFLMQLSDRKLGDYWRAVIGVDGRLIAISAAPAPGQRLEADAGRDLAATTAQAIRRANRGGS